MTRAFRPLYTRPMKPYLLAPALLLAACSSQPAPKLAVTDAAVTERTDAGTVITFTVHADNATGEPLPLREVEYEVWLHGKPVFKGTRSAMATVRAYGTQDFTLPAAIPAQLETPAAYSIQGTITYLVPGALAEALFDLNVLKPKTSFRGRGVVEAAP